MFIVLDPHNLVISWIQSTRSRDLGNILEVELLGLADGLSVGMMVREQSRRLQEFLF